MKIKLNKIASVTKNVGLKSEVEITKDIRSTNGLCLAVKVLENKKIYNELELCSGKLSILKKGEVLAVALGNRRALKGFVGDTPKKLAVSDVINILNMGGVAGLCTSENVKQVGHALKVKVLGAITDGKKALNVKDFKKFDPQDKLESDVPLVVVSGTCMGVGKTNVVCQLAKHASSDGLNVFVAKLSGVAAQKDTRKMKQFGARKAVSFLDAGLTSTVHSSELLKVAKGAINHLSEGKPDFIIIEFGDGVFGEYGVMDILKDKEISKHIAFHVGCAHDPMGAVKLGEVCKSIRVPLSLMSGPVTDNEVGSSFVKKTLKIPAVNALKNGGSLYEEFKRRR
ncbi:hypothetical protein KJ632_00575 [Patescibacteria group bacterium]|nr:hypothetical protein [Patescibacteria group bacterium]